MLWSSPPSAPADVGSGRGPESRPTPMGRAMQRIGLGKRGRGERTMTTGAAMKQRFQHIRDHLQQHAEARAQLDQAAHQHAQLAAIRAQLPDALGAHCLDLTLSNGRLTLFFDSTAWLTRARFLVGDILTSLESYHVEEVRFQVKLPEPDPQIAQRRPRAHLSETAARHLLEAAAQQSDPHLRATLQRLARLAKPVAD